MEDLKTEDEGVVDSELIEDLKVVVVPLVDDAEADAAPKAADSTTGSNFITSTERAPAVEEQLRQLLNHYSTYYRQYIYPPANQTCASTARCKSVCTP